MTNRLWVAFWASLLLWASQAKADMYDCIAYEELSKSIHEAVNQCLDIHENDINKCKNELELQNDIDSRALNCFEDQFEKYFPEEKRYFDDRNGTVRIS